MADQQQYFSLITDIGRFKIAQAAANKQQLKITHFAIGDGNGKTIDPVPGQKQLVHEVWRSQIEAVQVDPKNPAAVLVGAVIPRDVGGWWMREFGLFDADGDMIAVVKPAPSYKATVAEGQNEDIAYEFQLIIGENAQIVAVIDPSILYATRDYVNKRSIPPSQLSSLPWLPVISMETAVPPANADSGDVWLIPANAGGDWAGKSGQLAFADGKGGWLYGKPRDGHGIGLPDGRLFIRSSGAYQEFKSPDLSPYTKKTDLGSLNSGWAKMANGLIICWGLSRRIGGGDQRVALPITMPHAILCVVGSDVGAGCFPCGFYQDGNSAIRVYYPWHILSNDGHIYANNNTIDQYYIVIGW